MCNAVAWEKHSYGTHVAKRMEDYQIAGVQESLREKSINVSKREIVNSSEN